VKQRGAKRPNADQANKLTSKKAKNTNIENANRDGMLGWIDLFVALRLEQTGKNQDDDLVTRCTVWVIDEDPPRMVEGKIKKFLKTDDEGFKIWQVEIDKKDRRGACDDWRLEYPEWILFTNEEEAKLVYDTLVHKMNFE
jgi:hypothetical protein